MVSMKSFLVLAILLISNIKTSFLQSKDLRILNLADIHLDLHYDPSSGDKDLCRNTKLKSSFSAPYGRGKCDCPSSLFEQTLKKAKEVFISKYSQPPDYVIINGDTVGHKIASSYGYDDVLKHLRQVAQRIAYHFPDSIQLHSIGNNDLQDHYQVPKVSDKKAYYQFLFELWFGENAPSPKNRGLLTQRQREVFKLTGFYELKLYKHLKFISINSIFYSIKNNESNDPHGGQLQFELFKEALYNDNQNGQFIVAYHIPPGRDLLDYNQWVPSMAQRFLKIQDNFQNKIIANFAAHLHCPLLRGVGKYDGSKQVMSQIPILLSGSVTPIFQNNPSFRIYEIVSQKFDSKFKIKKYTDYAFNLRQLNQDIQDSSTTTSSSKVSLVDYYWSNYFDTQQLGLNQFNGQSIKNFWISTLSNNDQFIAELLRESFQDEDGQQEVIERSKAWMNIKIPSNLSDNWDLYCISLFPTDDEYKDCLKNKP